MMSLPPRARAVLASTTVLATALVSGLLGRYVDTGVGSLGTLALLTALVAASWSWPLLVYRKQSSDAVHADEGLLLIALLVLPPAGVLTAVGVAAAVGQLVHRRGLAKAVFNWAQVMVAASCAVLVSRAVGIDTSGSASLHDLLAAFSGVVAFFVASTLLIGAIVTAASPATWRDALLDDGGLGPLVLVVGCVIAAPVALAARATSWAILLLPALYAGVRWALAGRFEARHDRDRVVGLFDATLAVHKPLATSEVRTALIEAAADLLRSPDVELTTQPPENAELTTRLDVAGASQWLTMSGRQHSEPFDAADRRLADALSAVGQSALSHAEMYARAQRQSDELAAIMSSLAEGVIAFDADGQPTFVNPAGESILGASTATLTAPQLPPVDGLARGDEALVHSARESLMAIVRRSLRSLSTVSDESAIFLRFDGTTFPVSFTCAPILEGGVATGAVLVFRDVSERIATERELAHSAFHDQLTGLPNRRLFLDRLDQALRRAHRDGTTHAVLLADVDRFKVLNDNLGQQAGDELLQEIARRIGAVARPTDTIARFGGDEFTVLVEDVQGLAAAQRLAARILNELAVPVVLTEGREVVVSASIGIATSEGEATADDVLHDADVAMAQAKAAGTGSVHTYDPSAMHARSVHRFDLEADLRAAIANDELEVYYQPLIDLTDGTMHDVEALIRWPDPKQGMRMPGEFIPVAEESGLILPLGRFVLTQAALQAHLWEESGVKIGVAVNLSARQFQDPGLIQQISTALRLSKLPPDQLCLEITESLAMQDLELTVRTLHQLKGLGVLLAIDDFGTGHSSLNYLKRVPVDEVKIDRSFVRDLAKSKVDAAIVAAIVGLADALGIRTVVEGIEEQEQLDRVRELGCSLAQGYHVSRPQPAAMMTEMLVPAGAPAPASPSASPAARIPAPRQIDLTAFETH